MSLCSMLFSTSTLINQFLVTEEINQNSQKVKCKKKKKDHCKLLILYWKISHWKLWGLHFFKSYSSIRENGHFIWKSKAENVSWNNKTWYSLIKHDHRNINQITWLISMGKPGWGKTFSYSWFCTHSELWS